MLETLMVLMFLGLVAFIALGVEDKMAASVQPRRLSVTTPGGPALPSKTHRK